MSRTVEFYEGIRKEKLDNLYAQYHKEFTKAEAKRNQRELDETNGNGKPKHIQDEIDAEFDSVTTPLRAEKTRQEQEITRAHGHNLENYTVRLTKDLGGKKSKTRKSRRLNHRKSRRVRKTGRRRNV